MLRRRPVAAARWRGAEGPAAERLLVGRTSLQYRFARDGCAPGARGDENQRDDLGEWRREGRGRSGAIELGERARDLGLDVERRLSLAATAFVAGEHELAHLEREPAVGGATAGGCQRAPGEAA